MAPDPGRSYSVACAFNKAVPDDEHRKIIQEAVQRVHRCTFHATELLNLYVRSRIEQHGGEGLECIFTSNWLLNAYHAVKIINGRKQPKIDAGVKEVFDRYMADTFEKPDGAGLTQALMYECINLAAVGSTNVWMHFRKRVLSYVRSCFAISDLEYKQLTKDARTARKLSLLQIADDVCRNPAESPKSAAEHHAWVDAQRATLGIDAAVKEWGDKPLLYHLKARPQRFLKAMHLMSCKQVANERKGFALFPLRRSHVPRHVRFDKKVLDDLLKLGCAYAANKKAKAANAPNLNAPASGRVPKRKRDDPSLVEEKAHVFKQVLDLRAARVHRGHHFAFAFTTDGASLHLNMEKPGKQEKGKAPRPLDSMLLRGIHSIDALKAVSRDAQLHTIGIDPGKRELLVAVDQDDAHHKKVERYTLAQRLKHLRSRQYADEMRRSKPQPVAALEEELSLFNSRSPHLAQFAVFASKRRQEMRECAQLRAFYDQLEHRQRRRKTKIKAQQSEADLFKRLAAMHPKGDSRTPVLAYGAWGLQAGRPNQAANRGNPPAIGAGLMKRLALHFVVAPTPEHYTSKTCVKCGGLCGAHPTLKNTKKKEIRGLRVCQHEGCGLLQNRDRTGATNIGTQFRRLMRDEGPIKPMTDEEVEFHRLAVCIECGDDS